MRSGNGRHRRPRQAPALVVAAGVTGSAIAIPLLGATGASAADAATWDRVAECESGGMWSADFGNGHYGGLQIAQETWADFGGTAYAPTADQASRSQQIAVAEKILDAQGPTAWPTCALVTGLTADDGTAPEGEPSGEATQQPETPAEPEPAPESSEEAVLPPAPESTPSSGQFGRDSASGSEKPSTEPSTESSTGSGTKPGGEPSTEAGTGQGTGKHRGEADAGTGATDGSAEAGKTGKTDEDRESGRHASRGDGSARDGDTAAEDEAAADGSYTVQAGDNLWAIADEQKVEGGWPALYEANREVVGSDADLILPGQSLDLTAK
ncbi:transglycosylase family protein [Streptomyces sp. NPDC057137]|uniref:transglycosylase family protein n=1 Tax=Streptomyces sp. NPDC057137 TaxID=3346030 RepID=UPI00362CB269